jgi:hypothetical protein
LGGVLTSKRTKIVPVTCQISMIISRNVAHSEAFEIRKITAIALFPFTFPLHKFGVDILLIVP